MKSSYNTTVQYILTTILSLSKNPLLLLLITTTLEKKERKSIVTALNAQENQTKTGRNKGKKHQQNKMGIDAAK